MSKYGLNAIYAGKHWTKRRQDSEYWHYHVRNELRKQGIKKHIFDKPVRIVFSWDDRLDIDNHAYMGKLIADSFKGYFIEDDSRKYYEEVVHRFYKSTERKNIN